MKKILIPLLLLILVLAILLAFYRSKSGESDEIFPISEPSKNLEASAGNEFKIIIESNPSTGYHWELVGELDGDILEFVSRDYRASEPVIPGSGGMDVWTFKALSAGETTITLGYYPPAPGEPAGQEVTFTVLVR
jgi:inhibitor of cysteine peptidase